MSINESKLVECGHISVYPLYTNFSSTDISSDITACVVNIILSIFTTVGNVSVIVAYYNNKNLQTKSNLLIVSLAFTDVLVGVWVQPSFVWVKVKEMTGTIDCGIEIVSDLFTKFCIGISLVTLGVAVSGERYLAVFHPLKHRIWLTKAKLLYSIIVIWVSVGFFIVIILLGIPRVVYQSFGLGLIVLNLLVSATLYAKIAKRLRMKKSRVTPSCEIVHVVNSRLSRVMNAHQIRAAVTLFYVLTALFICYLPMLAGFIYVSLVDQDLFYQKFLWTWGVTFLFLNSFCNPFIYSWRNRNMSIAIRKLFLK